jgi:hypothetical protein
LRDYSLSPSRDRRLLPAWDLDRLAIATQCKFSVLVHGLKRCLSIMPQKKKMTNGSRHVKPLKR